MRCLKNFIFLLLLVSAKHIKGQSQVANSTGTINIISADSSVYNIATGQIMIIQPNGSFSGTVNINGGYIFNKGSFTPSVLTFASGKITNTGNLALSSQVPLNSSNQLNNNTGGIMSINGFLILSGGKLYNAGTLTVSQDIQNNTGLLNNSHIINCDHLTGNNPVVNTGTINTN